MWRAVQAFLFCVIGPAVVAVAAALPDAPMGTDRATPLPAAILVTVADSIEVRGDPVPLLIRIENRGTTTATVVLPQVRPPADTTVRFELRGPGEVGFRAVECPGIYSGSLKGRIGPRPLPVFNIEAGQSQVFRTYIGWDFDPADERQRRWLLPVAGKYAVRLAVWQLAQAAPFGTDTVAGATPVVPLVAELAAIAVVEPSDRANVVAADALLALPSHWLVCAPAYAGANVPEDLLVFRRQHVGSRDAAFAELAVIYSDFRAAVVGKNRTAAHAACDRARRVAEQAEMLAWPDGWRVEADRLLRVMSKEVLKLVP